MRTLLLVWERVALQKYSSIGRAQRFAVIENKTNDIMKTLAVVSAIIIPLTFIAGIYGMNLDNMPELHSKYDDAPTLLAMLLITVCFARLFLAKGMVLRKKV